MAACRRSSSARLGQAPLSFAEHEEIALLIAQGEGVREIARRLGRSPSTVSRELRRNAGARGGQLNYLAWIAQLTQVNAEVRPTPCRISARPASSTTAPEAIRPAFSTTAWSRAAWPTELHHSAGRNQEPYSAVVSGMR
ncbi:helix-turn-helix domain-containing protein [Streptomyces sp. NBC_01696]|uniref:helix-turn-helix domain-containing protein n=1 Tax=Streptomyces sp. NBC_01696 TaxID=2975913 RepID=UPI003FCDC271